MPTICLQPLASNQDCLAYRDFWGTWSLNLTDPAVRGGYKSWGQQSQVSGLYFPNVPIPPNSLISRAYLILRASDSFTKDLVFTVIEAEKNANPIPFSTLADFQARAKIPEAHSWSFVHAPWKKDILYSSPDFHGIITDVIGLPGWASGNSLVLFWGDESGINPPDAGMERAGYSFDGNPAEAPRLEITYEPPTPPAPPPPAFLPLPPPPPRKGWAGLDLEYEYLDTGFKLKLHTDTPCHLWCRMTSTPPRKHALPSLRRGTFLQGDIRFCFVTYEDNEQEEDGDTLIHTFLKPNWPICERRWFYFVGTVYGDPSPTETAIFEFHFPAPPPEPPPPLTKICYADASDRCLFRTHANWNSCRGSPWGAIAPQWDAPDFFIQSGSYQWVTHYILRGFLRFHTASLPDTARILTANLYLNCKYVHCTNPGAPRNIIITQGVQHDPIITTDYGDQLPWNQVMGQRDMCSMSVSAYSSIPFNDYGLSRIKVVEDTLLCLRSQRDVQDIASISYDTWIVWYDQLAGGGLQPYLEIKYYPA